MFILFVAMPFFGAFLVQALLFIKARNPIVRFTPTALGAFGLFSCALLAFVSTFVVRAYSASVVAENQEFAKFMALPFACALAGSLLAIGYVLAMQRIKSECK